jgi:REP element-mobilizing transposase RayT
MPKVIRPILDGQCYHTISVTRGRRALFLDPKNAKIVLDTISYVRQNRKAFLLAYVVMPDHLHLLIAPREPQTIASVMHTIKSYSARQLQRQAGIHGSIWQQGYFDRMMRTDEHLGITAEYIERNPVTAGLVTDPAAYSFSSANPDLSTDSDEFWNG